jgi:hypothetical protein
MPKNNSWGDVTPGGGSADYLKLEPGDVVTVHVLNGEMGPKVFHSIYFEAVNRGAVVDPDNNPLSGLADGFEVKKRYAFNLFDLADGKVKVYSCGSQVANAIKAVFEEYGNLDDVDIKISRVGSGLKTKYTVMPIKKKFTDDMLEGQEAKDLDELFELTSEEDITALSRGEDPKAEFDTDKIDGKKKAAPAPEEEAPPAAEEEAPPTAEEDAPPAKKAAPAPAKEEGNRAALLQSIKANFAKLKRYANPKQQLVDISHYGGKDAKTLSQMETAQLQKLLAFQKTAK